MSRGLFLVLLVLSSGCASRSGWGFPWGQGTVDAQKSRAVVHDPYPLNDIGPEVLGGRPRDFMTGHAMTDPSFPHDWLHLRWPQCDIYHLLDAFAAEKK